MHCFIAQLCRVIRPRCTAATLVISSPEPVVISGAIDGHIDFANAKFSWHAVLSFPNGSKANASGKLWRYGEGKLVQIF